MDENEVDALEDAESWAWDAAATFPANEQAQAVVSVAFSREDFARLSAYAREVGEPLSRVVRDAALAKVEVGRQTTLAAH